MKVIVPGHRYEAAHLDGNGVQIIQFVDRGHGNDTEGTTCQELVRVLIDRVQFLEKELPSEFNDDILYHARMMLIYFEARALVRKVEKGELNPECLVTDEDDLHIKLTLNHRSAKPKNANQKLY